MNGSEKSSGSASESESSSGHESSSSGYDPPDESSESSSSGSSSSCACAWELTEVYLDEDSASAGEFTIENTGCGTLLVTALESNQPGTWNPDPPVAIPEGEFRVFRFEGSGDIRGTGFTVTTDCGPPHQEFWPVS